MKDNYTYTIAGAAILIAFFSILSRGLGFVREIVFAGYFGLSNEFDLYLIGTVLPITINTILLYVAQNLFIPAYNKLKISNNNSAEDFFYQQLRYFFLFSLILAFFLYILALPVLKIYQPGISGEFLDIATLIFQISIVSIPINAVVSIIMSYNQAHYDFKNPAISQLFLNIVIIIMIILFKNVIDIYVIPIGYIIGSIFQLIYLTVKSGISLKKLFSTRKKYLLVKGIGAGSFIIVVLIESIGQFYMLVDRFFYTFVDPGGIASISYAQNLFFLPLQIFSIALSTAIFPKITELFANGKFSESRITISKSIDLMITIFVPISVIILLFGDSLIQIVYQRGSFNSNDTKLTFSVLQYFTLSLVFYAVYSLINKVLYTANLLRQLLIITVIGISLKLLLNILLVKTFKQDGLALSTSLTFIFFFTAGYIVLISKKIFLFEKKIVLKFLFAILNCLFSYLITDSLFILFQESTIFLELLKISSFTVIYISGSYFYDKESIELVKDIFARFTAK